ncbi:hypothetical protein L6452_42713 [Arctium lappa]|uniref:Uncharacterized protein n=1 Tax=Arctium lappa TaxID=4217 RepID=A0ACB8XJJ8_ARCLA|nr:hypothetical protein L6452_42713 [Arctium lappa]
MAIKRSWEDDREVENLAMANCLMLLSRVGQSDPQSDRVFHCKTCNKQFKSFQALGGHRASHKRPKSSAEQSEADQSAVPPKPKSHECSICGLEFAIGQALGGHMRRHRDGGSEKSGRPEVARRAEAAPEKRGLCLDLNLTPYENDMKVWNSSVKTALAI